jgi:hydrogenase maturation protein HypF
MTLPVSILLDGICKDLKAGKDKSYIAATFHYSLVQLIRSVATAMGNRKLCFSGGVFQNALLVDLLCLYLREDFELYFHRELPPNDENISFGQLVYFDHNIDGAEAQYPGNRTAAKPQQQNSTPCV